MDDIEGLRTMNHCHSADSPTGDCDAVRCTFRLEAQVEAPKNRLRLEAMSNGGKNWVKLQKPDMFTWRSHYCTL